MSARTRSQSRILQLLERCDRAISAQDIYVELRSRERAVGLATIYRALESLKLEGVVRERTLSTGESLYSCTQQADRHYLTCLHCGRSIAIDECPVEQLENRLESVHQFKIYYHTLEFFGICADCAPTTANNNLVGEASQNENRQVVNLHHHHNHDLPEGTA